MASDVTRRQLLRADPRGRRAPVRPPWATARFHDDCTRCDDCLPACPERILVRGDGGFPQVDFARGECTFCGDCVTVCKPAALRRADVKTAPWPHVALVAPDCLQASGVQCHACVDPCPEAAVTVRPGSTLPTINLAACSGCGACVAPCPVDAIRIGTPTPANTEVAA
jgi:ferredoxin-type protein NapF